MSIITKFIIFCLFTTVDTSSSLDQDEQINNQEEEPEEEEVMQVCVILFVFAYFFKMLTLHSDKLLYRQYIT